MNTPPRKRKLDDTFTTSSTTKTPYVARQSPTKTPEAPVPKITRSDEEDENHRKYLKRKIEELPEIDFDKFFYDAKDYYPDKPLYDARVAETEKMVFKLPKKNGGGRKSTKRGKKHQKKTSKKRSRK